MLLLKRIAEKYAEPCQISKVEMFAKTVNGLKPLTVFTKTLHLRCLTGFLIRLCISITSKTISRAEYFDVAVKLSRDISTKAVCGIIERTHKSN